LPYSRDLLKQYLEDKGIPSMIYYPIPLHKQRAYEHFIDENLEFPVSNSLCEQVLSLPMHTHLEREEIEFIVKQIKNFFNN
jgi:dTDP-4-amino-4,6-dideoxygalactose transaminase